MCNLYGSYVANKVREPVVVTIYGAVEAVSFVLCRYCLSLHTFFSGATLLVDFE